ncbi:MAG: hypothetical protein SF052_21865 [Bacteroidia bacterium]|nr:hypothetical protein [Bacteroidia bacterium]
MKPQKYRINAIFEQINDPKTVEQIKALVCWRLRIWHTTFYRKVYAKIDDYEQDRTFDYHDMVTICRTMNDIVTFDPPLTLKDLYYQP